MKACGLASASADGASARSEEAVWANAGRAKAPACANANRHQEDREHDEQKRDSVNAQFPAYRPDEIDAEVDKFKSIAARAKP